MIIYPSGVYTFNGQIQEEDMQMFWVYRYKGFSFTAARTVHTALVLAGQQGCSQADTGHLLLALVQTAQGTAADFLRRKRVTSTALAEHTAAHAAGRPRRLHSRDLAPELSKAMEFAVLGAHAASAARAENEHLLCAILEDSSCTASRWLAALGIELPQAARECRQLSGQLVLPAQPRMAASRTGRPSDKYGRDLTRLAQEGRLDPVLCRDAELDRMIEILCRRQKNNPCLLGEPGVGKSALAEALAQRIAAGQITPALRGKRVLALDMASMVAGTKYRGDFEERFKNLLEELYRDRSTILFIDEIHIIAGAGAAEGAIDAASILKPMLARGEIQLIGATTPEEYRKTIQKDSALERRFGRVMVEEPTPAAAETILAGLMPRYERYHGVSIPPEAIHAAVELSVRYLPGRYLPDKAIDLVDEACAMVKTELDSMPAELDEMNHRITQLQIEEASLKKETDELSKQRLATLEKEMAELRDSFNSKKAQWENEKNAVNKVQSLRAEVESTKAEIEKATRTGDYAKAGELQYGKLPTLQKQLEEEEKIAEAKKESSLLRDRVTDDEIARIVARWTGIPVSKLVEGEREKLLRLPDTLHQRVIGQDEAVQKVADAILRSRAGIANPNRPIGSFLFLGPTGVGKTELAKALAQALFDDEKNMVRIDMTEYMEKFSVSRLIGAPPGYVGYEEGGQLTEAVRRHPYSVVLFDEVEKAHPDVFNILLQVLDDGRITDSQGRTVDFKNTVIILTSNLGSDLILEDLEKSRAMGKNELSEEAKNAIDQLLKRQFRPEFLNRLDDIVYYKSLTKQEIGSIVDLMLADLRRRLADKQLNLVVTDAAKNAIIDGGYDPIYGARPLKRYIQSHVETMIAKEIIGGAHTAGDTLTVDADGNGQLMLR